MMTELSVEKRIKDMCLGGKRRIRFFQLFEPEPKKKVSGVNRWDWDWESSLL